MKHIFANYIFYHLILLFDQTKGVFINFLIHPSNQIHRVKIKFFFISLNFLIPHQTMPKRVTARQPTPNNKSLFFNNKFHTTILV